MATMKNFAIVFIFTIFISCSFLKGHESKLPLKIELQEEYYDSTSNIKFLGFLVYQYSGSKQNNDSLISFINHYKFNDSSVWDIKFYKYSKEMEKSLSYEDRIYLNNFGRDLVFGYTYLPSVKNKQFYIMTHGRWKMLDAK